MSLSKLYTGFAVKLHTKTAQSGAAVYVDGVQDLALNSELADQLEGGDGLLYNTFGAIGSGAPMLRLTTNDVKALLDAAGFTGMLIDADETHPGVVGYCQAYANGGTRGGASVHVSATIPNGLLVPRQIELPHRGAAVVSAEAFARKNSTTAPVTFSETDSLPSIYAAVSAMWTLGPWKLGANEIPGIERVSIDPGIEIVAEAGDSDIYPTFIAIRRIQPRITIAARHVDVTSFLTEDGLYSAAASVVGYARKRSEGGTFVADGTAEHIKFTLGKCRANWRSIGGDPKSIEIEITPYYTNAASPVLPITISTDSAIT